MGPQEPAELGRRRTDRDGDDRLRRRPRALPAAGQDRDRDLAPQDDPVQLLHDGAGRDDGPQGRPLPPRLPLRPVLSDRLRPRARRGPRLPALADPGQGLLREQGRARLQPAGQLRPPRLRVARRLADGDSRRGPRGSSSATGSTGWSSATTATTARSSPPATATARRGKGSVFATEFSSSRQLVAWLLGWRQNAAVHRAARARRRGGGAPRAAPRHGTRATSRRPSRSPSPRSPRPSAAAARTARPRP